MSSLAPSGIIYTYTYVCVDIDIDTDIDIDIDNSISIKKKVLQCVAMYIMTLHFDCIPSHVT